MAPNILVAGIGNIFLGDDGFGVEVAKRLLKRPQPAGVKVADYGIRGFDLAFALMDGYDTAILIDALPRGGRPGSLYILEPDLAGLAQQPVAMETHNLDPAKVIRLVQAFGGQPGRVYVLGCEPATFGPEELGQMGLSEPVENVVDEAVSMAEEMIGQLCQEGSINVEKSRA